MTLEPNKKYILVTAHTAPTPSKHGNGRKTLMVMMPVHRQTPDMTFPLVLKSTKVWIECTIYEHSALHGSILSGVFCNNDCKLSFGQVDSEVLQLLRCAEEYPFLAGTLSIF